MKSTNLYFDKMHKSDIRALMQIECASYPVPWSPGVMLDCMQSDYHCIVLKQAGIIVAYGILMTANDEAHLLNMCVAKNSHGRGLGRKLLKYLENICIYNKVKRFLLEVRVSSPVAQSLYQSFGFKQIGMRKNYYKTVNAREDAIVMQKKLL